jgi:hypothetical protein
MRAFERLIQLRSGMKMFEQDELLKALEERGYVEVRQRVAGFTQFIGGRLSA